MSETGSEFDATDATDSPFECLTDGDGNGNGRGKRHVDMGPPAHHNPLTDHFAIPTRSPANMQQFSQSMPPIRMPGSKPSANPVPAQSGNVGHELAPAEGSAVPAASPVSAGGDSINAPLARLDLSGQQQEVAEPAAQPLTPATSGDEEDGFLSWFSSGRGSLLSRVAEKAKNSVDSVITTLDPGMKEYLYSGGAVNIVVASDKECKVSPIREAFIDVFGRATVKGIGASPDPVVAPQPVGVSAAQVAAAQRIAYIRQQLTNDVPQNQVIVALENFLVEMSPGSWYDMGCLYLDDPLTGLQLVTYTQSTPVPYEAINFLQFETPNDYVFRSSGFKKTIGHFMSEKLSIPNDAWHEAVVGIPRRSIVYMAACALARIFKDKLAR